MKKATKTIIIVISSLLAAGTLVFFALGIINASGFIMIKPVRETDHILSQRFDDETSPYYAPPLDCVDKELFDRICAIASRIEKTSVKDPPEDPLKDSSGTSIKLHFTSKNGEVTTVYLYQDVLNYFSWDLNEQSFEGSGWDPDIRPCCYIVFPGGKTAFGSLSAWDYCELLQLGGANDGLNILKEGEQS